MSWQPGKPRPDHATMNIIVQEDWSDSDPEDSGQNRYEAMLSYTTAVVDDLRDSGFIYCWYEDGQRLNQRGDTGPQPGASPEQVEAWREYQKAWPNGPDLDTKSHVRWQERKDGSREWLI